MAGSFVALEGLDGSGLHEFDTVIFDTLGRCGLRERWLTREPSDGPVGQLVRLHLAGRLDIATEALPLFFAADRVNHLVRPDGILERLERGESIICDRYYLSSYAYQTADVAPETEEFLDRLRWLREVNEPWCRVPDLTLFFDVPVDSCLRRMLAEQRELGHYQAIPISDDPSTVEVARERLTRVRTNYLAAIKLLEADGGRKENIRIIGAGNTVLTPSETKREIEREIDKLLRKRTA